MVSSAGMVQTVTGPVEPRQLGTTLMHEHLLVDLTSFFVEPSLEEERRAAHAPVSMDAIGSIRWDERSNLDNLSLSDEKVAADELTEFRLRGGSTLVDATPVGIGRNPLGLKRIAEKTGLNVIAGSGYYISRTHPKELSRKSAREIAEEIRQEFENGIADTGVRPGIIGEIGNSHPWSEAERKVVRASAIVQQETGAAITVHPGRDQRSPMKILRLLQAEGTTMERVVMGHLDRTIGTLEGLEEVAAQSCYLEFDMFGVESHYAWSDFNLPNDSARINMVKKLVERGYVDQILLSHDVCTKRQLKMYGGYGYSHILEHIVPWMRRRGIKARQTRRMLVDNPMRVLAFAKI